MREFLTRRVEATRRGVQGNGGLTGLAPQGGLDTPAQWLHVLTPELGNTGGSLSDYAKRIIRFVRANVGVATEICTAEVEVESPGLGSFVGSAQGGISEADQLRAVARATADALSDAFEADNARVRVIGVHVVDVVPHSAVMVRLAASKGTHNRTLLGVCDGDTHDTPTATALAVLNATNRFLSRR